MPTEAIFVITAVIAVAAIFGGTLAYCSVVAGEAGKL